MKLAKSQRGFSAVEIIMAIVIIGLLATVGWFVYDRQNGNKDKQKSSTQTQIETQTTVAPKEKTPVATRKEYKDDVAAYSFTYLNNWKLGENERVETQPRAYLESPDYKVEEGQGPYSSKLLSGVSIVFSGTTISQKDKTADNIGDTGGYACDYDKKILTINGKKVFQCKNDTLGRQITITVFFKDNGLRIESIRYGLKEEENKYSEAYNDILNSLKY
jgi:prepilin-type N-terminal cleavage/methylation domain-containing protein